MGPAPEQAAPRPGSAAEDAGDQVMVGIAARSQDDPQLARLLDRLEAQTRPAEVRVVAGADRTVAQAKNVLVDQALEAGADALVFVDTDEVPADATWVAEITDFQGADIVTGPVVPVGVETPAARYLARLEEELVAAAPEDPAVLLWENSAWRTGVFRALRDRYGYVVDEAFVRGGEDWDLNLRVEAMGFRVRFNPRARVHHDYGGVTLPQAVRKRYRYCVGGALAYLKNRRPLGGPLRRSLLHPLEAPIRAAAFLRALLLHWGVG